MKDSYKKINTLDEIDKLREEWKEAKSVIDKKIIKIRAEFLKRSIE